MSAEFPEVRPPDGRTYPEDVLSAVAVGCGVFCWLWPRCWLRPRCFKDG